MLQEHGSFAAVEVELKRYHKKEDEEELEGGWHTQVSLEKENWTEILVSIMHVHVENDFICWVGDLTLGL